MKKILIIIPFLSVLLFFSNFSVKANNVTSFPAFPSPVEGKSSTHYIIYQNVATKKYFLIQPLDANSITVQERSDCDIFLYVGPSIKYTWVEGSNSWEKYREFTGSEGLQKSLVHDRYSMLYSSINLYYEDGSIFFQRAPIKVSFLTQMKKIQMGAVLETVAKMVPVVMIAVAGFLGFRKAFNLLLKVFHQA